MSVWWALTRAAGALSLVSLTAVMIMGWWQATPRAAAVAPTRDHLVRSVVLARVHRTVALGTVAFLVLHIATSVLDGYVDLGVAATVIPFVSGWRPFAIGLGTLALDLLLAIVVTALLRHRLPETGFRVVHLLALVLWPLSVAHAVLASSVDGAWIAVLATICAVSGVAVLLRRLIRRGADARARTGATVPAPVPVPARGRS